MNQYTRHFQNIILAFAALVLSNGCSNAIKDEKKAKTEEKSMTELMTYKYQWVHHDKTTWYTKELKILTVKDLYGYWVGSFRPDTVLESLYSGENESWDYSNKINLCIDSISVDSVYGHSVVAGNSRPFIGYYTFNDSVYSFELKEPGDDKYDGVFTCSIAHDGSKIEGAWSSYKPLKISKRKYVLEKKTFEYSPDIELGKDNTYVDWSKKKKRKPAPQKEDYYEEEYLTTTNDVYKYNASKALLTADDVSNLTKADLFIVRNAIYARHGYSFKNRQLRAYFDGEDWYIPLYTDVKDQLTETEKQNIKLLMRYEKNAEEYYDEFGRG